MPERVQYGGYEILPEPASTGWSAWILFRDIPYGRVNGERNLAAVVAAAKHEIDRLQRGPI